MKYIPYVQANVSPACRAGTSLTAPDSVESMLLAEDLLLLVTNDASGRLSVPSSQADAGLGGANLLELTLLGKVDVSGPQDQGKPGRIVVRDPSPAGDEVLEAALQLLVAQQGKKPSAVIRPLGKNLRPALYQRLAASGVLRAAKGRVLGIVPVRSWPAQDRGHKAGIREQVTQALIQPGTPDERTAALISLLHALKCEHKVVDPRACGLSRHQLRARAREIAQGNWASDAVRKAIDEMVAAVAAASAAAAAASSG